MRQSDSNCDITLALLMARGTIKTVCQIACSLGKLLQKVSQIGQFFEIFGHRRDNASAFVYGDLQERPLLKFDREGRDPAVRVRSEAKPSRGIFYRTHCSTIKSALPNLRIMHKREQGTDFKRMSRVRHFQIIKCSLYKKLANFSQPRSNTIINSSKMAGYHYFCRERY